MIQDHPDSTSELYGAAFGAFFSRSMAILPHKAQERRPSSCKKASVLALVLQGLYSGPTLQIVHPPAVRRAGSGETALTVGWGVQLVN